MNDRAALERAEGNPRATADRPARTRACQIFLVLLAVEGFAAFMASLSTPSMERRQLLLGYSIPRLALSASIAAVSLVLMCGAFWAIKRPGSVDRLLGALESRVGRQPGWLDVTQASLLLLSVTGFYALLLFQLSAMSDAPYLIQVAMDRVGPSMWWLFAVPLEALILSVFLFRDRDGSQVRRAVAAPGLLLLYAVVVGGALQCITLLLRADVLFSIRGWFWESVHTPFRVQQLALLPIGVVAIATVGWMLGRSDLRARDTVVAIALLYLLQFAFGLAEGRGWVSLREKYANAPISWETRAACEYPGDALEAILNYEDNFSSDFWLGTKPPGLLSGLVAAKGLISALYPGQFASIEECKHAMTTVFAYVLPLVASLVLLPMMGLERILGGTERPRESAVLYMAVPSVLLMPLVRDQFLFPLLFAMTLLVLGKAIINWSLPLAVVAGVLIFVAVFFSFSLLPIVALAIAWPLTETLSDRQALSLRKALAIVVAVAVGIGIAWAVGKTLLGYDPVARYTGAMEQHRAIKGYVSSLGSLWQYTKLNLVEFVISLGIPFVLLLSLAGLESIVSAARGRIPPRAAFALALIVCFVVMNLVGQTRGEVARLWLFLVAPLSIVAAGSLRHLPRTRDLGVQVVFVVQFLIVLTTYLNMDYR